MRKILIKLIIMLIVAISAASCSKNENLPPSDLEFSATCDFSGWAKTEDLKNIKGVLEYTDHIQGFEYPFAVFVLIPEDEAAAQFYIVCNMPVNFQMEYGESRNVAFSGRTWKIPEGATADSFLSVVPLASLTPFPSQDLQSLSYTPYKDIQLSYIKFE